MPLARRALLFAGASAALPAARPVFAQAKPTLKSGMQRIPFLLGREAHNIITYAPPDFEPEHPSPLVVLVEPSGSWRGDDIRRAGWTAQADKVGCLVVSLSPVLAHPPFFPTAFQNALKRVGEYAKVDANRVYLVGDPRALAPVFAAAVLPATGSPPTAPGTPVLTHRPERPPSAAEQWAFLDRHPRLRAKPVPTRLTVRVSGLRNDKGALAFALFRGPEGYPDDYGKAYEASTAPVAAGSATLTFDRVPPDDYALLLLHDEDGDGKMSTSFGFPLEGFAASNNARARMGAPSFADARFHVAGDRPDRRVRVRMTYLT